MTLHDSAARAYLTHIAEPGDTYVGRLLQLLTAEEVVRSLRHGGTTDSDRYRPRMNLGDDQAVSDWYQATLQRTKLVFLTPFDAKWPTALDDLGDARPAGLWVRGDAQALAELGRDKSVAIVGARAATTYGDHVAMNMAAELAQHKVPIVSGGAYGIDAAAHRGALTAGGFTVCFLAAGADRAYPAGNSDLIARIAQSGGAVVSEVPPGSAPTRWRFLQRNRLIAAAAPATVVVEAGFRSGSLNTASHADKLGRKLGAVPGPITSAASAGCHRLLRDYNATCITSADDVLQMLELPRQRDTEVVSLDAGTLAEFGSQS